MNLSLGCGFDKRADFINVDANKRLDPDFVVQLGEDSLFGFFKKSTVERVIAHDIVEHLFHWQAVRLLKEIHALLVPGGSLELRLPDFEAIVEYPVSSDEKITALFGGQDRPQGEADSSYRKERPEFYCHKFSYTKNSMRRELEAAGFWTVSCETVGTNMVIECVKEKG